MNDASSSMMLIGIGGAGSAMARGVCRAFGDGLKYLLTDTDAKSGEIGGPFTLLGGDRLSGRGAGGIIVNARHATEDSVQLLDEPLSGIRLAIIVTALGGGTGGGATLEIVKHLNGRGISSIIFATLPFAFEGDDRARNANSVSSLIADEAGAAFFLPLDKLVGNAGTMEDGFRRAIDTVASGVTLFWRLVEKPGYLRLDAERIRHLLSHAGRGRFATITVQGTDRAAEVVDRLSRSEMLATSGGPVQSILCGILAGEDLRLSEVGQIATGIRRTFGERCAFELATVNDEATFSGRLSVVVLLFETDPREIANTAVTKKGKRHGKDALVNQSANGRFSAAEATVWHGENLDIPTFIRQNLNLDF